MVRGPTSLSLRGFGRGPALALLMILIIFAVTVILEDGFEQVDGLLRLGRGCPDRFGGSCMQEGSCMTMRSTPSQQIVHFSFLKSV